VEPIDDNHVSLTIAELNAMGDLMEEARKELVRLNGLVEQAVHKARQWRERSERVALAWKEDDAAQLEAHATNILLWLWSEAVNPETESTNESKEGQ